MMTRVASVFTPEALLGAPRRSAGIPNADASKVLFIASTWSFDDHAWQPKKLCALDSAKQETHVLLESSDIAEVAWLDPEESTVLLLRNAKNGAMDLLMASDVHNFVASLIHIGSFAGPVGNIKTTKLAEKKYGIAVTGTAEVDGSLYNAQTAKKAVTTGKLYNTTFVRHWDTWISKQRNSIFYSSITVKGKDTKLTKLQNVIPAKLQSVLESPMPPFGGTDHFDISPKGILFLSKAPKLSHAFNTKCNLYHAPLETFEESSVTLQQINMPSSFDGALSSPVFSKDGSKAALLAMKENGYESDRNHILIIPDTAKISEVTDSLLPNPAETWDHSPKAIVFTDDSSALLLHAEDQGRDLLWSIPLTPEGLLPSDVTAPTKHTTEGGVSGIVPLPDQKAFITTSTLTASSIYSVVSLTSSAPPPTQLSSTAATFGLSRSSICEMWSPAAKKGLTKDDSVHSWVVLPPDFDASKKYPVAMLVHGGPQGAWTDDWSTRWHPAVFAAQGYVVLLPNPTGSTGYGQAFVDAIANDWGGLPYDDLVLAWAFAKKHLPYIDPDRAVLGGASYGGYMTNWIQGHDLGREFKALFTHDGVFSTTYELATDEMYFAEHDLGGSFAANPAGWARHDPAAHVKQWRTPHLVIHGEKDYRLGVTDGLAAFNVLQAAGVESQLLIFPDENHFVLNPENSLRWHEVVFTWLNKHVGLPPYGEADLEGITMN